jgi:DNA-binding XRE family transcriptional regulator
MDKCQNGLTRLGEDMAVCSPCGVGCPFTEGDISVRSNNESLEYIQKQIKELHGRLEIARESEKLLIGEKIRDARKAGGLDQSQLAAIVGVKRTQICNIELGNSWSSLGTFREICIALDVSADDLLGIQK